MIVLFTQYFPQGDQRLLQPNPHRPSGQPVAVKDRMHQNTVPRLHSVQGQFQQTLHVVDVGAAVAPLRQRHLRFAYHGQRREPSYVAAVAPVLALRQGPNKAGGF